MAKTKKIKLNKIEQIELDNLHYLINVAYFGIAAANKLHHEARERLWAAIWAIVPEAKGCGGSYREGVVTYTPKKE